MLPDRAGFTFTGTGAVGMLPLIDPAL